MKQEHNKIIMVSLEYRMDFSRLNVTALDNNKNNIENTAIVFVGFKPTYFFLFSYK